MWFSYRVLFLFEIALKSSLNVLPHKSSQITFITILFIYAARGLSITRGSAKQTGELILG